MNLSKILKKSILRKLLQNEVSEERTYFALTLITGLGSAIIAVSLNKGIHFLTSLFGTDKSFDLTTFTYGGLAILISGWLTTRKFPSTSGSGVPGVRVALAVYHGKLKLFSTIAKYFTSLLSLSSGFSLGREGPTVSIAAGLGSNLGTFFHLSKKRVKALVAVGSAGGIAAAFNTPISAVVFTLEEIVGDLNAKMLGSIVISSVIAAVTAQVLQGNDGSFQELHYQLNSPLELFLYLAVGLLAAIVGPLWVKSVLKYREMSLKIFKGHKLTIIMVTFFIMALLSHVDPRVLGSGHETIEEALLSLFLDWKILLSLFCLKFVATTICYGSGASGGLFMPTLLMGAMLGGFVGSISKMVFPEVAGNIGAFALVGMGAYFAAVIRSPFTSIIIVFELTRDYNIILPLMIANIVSYIISSHIHEGSIYENISKQDGIHLPTREDNEVLESMNVEDAMIDNPVTLSSQMPIKEAAKAIKDKKISGYPVTKQGVLIGVVSVADINNAYAARRKGQSILEDICNKSIIKVYPDQSLLVAFHKLKKFHVSRLPVVSRINDRRIVGIITAQDIVNRFGFHIKGSIEEIT